mmetsp:Transcript_19846/g.31609  ORF Transcript_19846/g.31609 Transcript_19846/m.31609 type:complete len:318 (-) Transcript_19846:153-1106(-)
MHDPLFHANLGVGGEIVVAEHVFDAENPLMMGGAVKQWVVGVALFYHRVCHRQTTLQLCVDRFRVKLLVKKQGRRKLFELVALWHIVQVERLRVESVPVLLPVAESGCIAPGKRIVFKLPQETFVEHFHADTAFDRVANLVNPVVAMIGVKGAQRRRAIWLDNLKRENVLIAAVAMTHNRHFGQINAIDEVATLFALIVVHTNLLQIGQLDVQLLAVFGYEERVRVQSFAKDQSIQVSVPIVQHFAIARRQRISTALRHQLNHEAEFGHLFRTTESFSFGQIDLAHRTKDLRLLLVFVVRQLARFGQHKPSRLIRPI